MIEWFPSMFNGKTSIHILLFVLYLGFHFPHCWISSSLSMVFIIAHSSKDLFYVLLSSSIERRCTLVMFYQVFVQDPSSHSGYVPTLVDVGFLKDLLPTNLIPSTPTPYIEIIL